MVVTLTIIQLTVASQVSFDSTHKHLQRYLEDGSIGSTGRAWLLRIYPIIYDKVMTMIQKIQTSKNIYIRYAKHLESPQVIRHLCLCSHASFGSSYARGKAHTDIVMKIR